MPRKRVLIFIVAYNAEHTISNVLARLPEAAFNHAGYSCDVLIIDDCSPDATFREGHSAISSYSGRSVTILRNPHNQGYGGNQKLGYRYAIDQNYDVVVLLHGDGQYAPESIPELIAPVVAGECDALFGSRMANKRSAREGGMPFYKLMGNILLTKTENFLLGAALTEWHSGYRVYSCAALDKIPFQLNSNDFDFDTEIIIQLLLINSRIRELPIKTFYGDEVCHVNGLRYARLIIWDCILSRLQQLGILYDPKFDVRSDEAAYLPKFSFHSSHSLALEAVNSSDMLLLISSGTYTLTAPIITKAKRVCIVDHFVDEKTRNGCHAWYEGEIEELDLDETFPDIEFSKVLVLDTIEHLDAPETLLNNLRHSRCAGNAEILITTPNVAFFLQRIMLLIGQFNYGKRGILDFTHRRLFTRSSLQRTLQQQGFEICDWSGIPAPFPLALPSYPKISALLLKINGLLLRLFPGLFSYQLIVRAKPFPSVGKLLQDTWKHTEEQLNTGSS